MLAAGSQRHPLEPFQRARIELAAEVSLDGVQEWSIFLADLGEQGHAGAKFQIVRIAENLANRAAFDRIDEAGAREEADPQDRMARVGRGFLAGGNRKLFGGRASTQAFDLRENEPHPMAGLATIAKLRTDLLVYLILRVEEPL